MSLSFLSFAELSRLVDIASEVFGFNPAKVVEDYYTLTTTELAPDTIYLHISFVGKAKTDTSYISPFPRLVEN